MNQKAFGTAGFPRIFKINGNSIVHKIMWKIRLKNICFKEYQKKWVKVNTNYAIFISAWFYHDEKIHWKSIWIK